MSNSVLTVLVVVLALLTALSLALSLVAFRAVRVRRRGSDASPLPTDVQGLRDEVQRLRSEASGSLRHLAVVRYDVHRADVAGFTTTAGTKVGQSTTTSYTDADRPAGTWYYRVVAVDGAGNASDASAVASVRSDTTHTKVPSPAHANAGCQSPRAPAKTTGQASAVSALLYTSAKGYFARLERAVSTLRN